MVPTLDLITTHIDMKFEIYDSIFHERILSEE